MPIGSVISSHVSVRPGNISWISWVVACWVRELTIVVFGVKFTNDGLADSDEIVNELHVGDVSVEVVLEVLNHVHVLLDLIESSNSWEGERFVKELPGVNCRKFFAKFLSDLNSIEVVLLVKFTGKLIHLPLHLGGTLP